MQLSSINIFGFYQLIQVFYYPSVQLLHVVYYYNLLFFVHLRDPPHIRSSKWVLRGIRSDIPNISSLYSLFDAKIFTIPPPPFFLLHIIIDQTKKSIVTCSYLQYYRILDEEHDRYQIYHEDMLFLLWTLVF